MAISKIADLFASDINRRIEEVIKVDQADEQIIHDEISEYVVTDSIQKHYQSILDLYAETPNKPHEGIAVWISGFFGSGKSSFAKILGLAVGNRTIQNTTASELFAQRAGNDKTQVLLKTITEKIPTEAVIFDVSTDRGIRTGNQNITEIMYRLFLEHLGYARDLDLSELEISLEADGRLDEFKATYKKLYEKDWDKQKGKIAFAIQEASRVMSELDPKTYPTVDSWRESAINKADINPGKLAERCKELMARRCPNRSLMFVIDEVGQFVARDVQKMLDLQAVVQSLARVGRGKMWIAVTSQEKLNELVGGIDDRRVELARLMDRFPQQVHLEPSDISEVTSKRVLTKNAEAQKVLRELFQQSRGRLTDSTRLTADIKLPDLETQAFVDLYPMLPYQIDLVIQVVSGLRTQGGMSKHVGGANRTIIKLAQQLLIRPDVNLADQTIGKLARIDQIYDLVSENIASEVRGKIDAIQKEVENPLAQPVAKAICLLQYVKSIHRTAENIAASLHPAVDADSRLSEVRQALDALLKAHMVRLGDDGYRIPTPAEDDWERKRSSLQPKAGDVNRIHAELITDLWKPEPKFNFLDTKIFKAGLVLKGRTVVDGDIPIHLMLAEQGKDYQDTASEMRTRSQAETKNIFWVAELSDSIDRETVEVFRSKEILARKEREAKTKTETALVAEEKTRLRRHLDELKKQIRQVLLNGEVFFRGNDRSPDENAADVGKAAGKLLEQALPEVFDRFHEAAAKVKAKDLESLLTSENLRGLPPVFVDLNLIKDKDGKTVFNVDNGPLSEVLIKIKNRTDYGESASGRYLVDEFAKEPYGWDFEVVRLFVVSLLRSGKIEATSKGNTIDSALSLDAKTTFQNNNLFKSSSFRPKEGPDFRQLAKATDAFKEVFGREISEIEESVISSEILKAAQKHRDQMQDVLGTLRMRSLPGTEVMQSAIDQMKAMHEQTIQTFNSSFKHIKDAIKRTSELSAALTIPNLKTIDISKLVLESQWPVLEQIRAMDDAMKERAAQLADIMNRETFYKQFPEIDQLSSALNKTYQANLKKALQARSDAYTRALDILKGTPGWEQLSEEQQSEVAEPLDSKATNDRIANEDIPQIHADIDACSGRLEKAIREMLNIIDGERVVYVKPSDYFKGGVESEEQLQAALDGLREECERLIGSGKKVVVQ